MDAFDVRMRCIEALAQTGVREPQRLVNDAKTLEQWVLAATPLPEQDKAKRPPKAAG